MVVFTVFYQILKYELPSLLTARAIRRARYDSRAFSRVQEVQIDFKFFLQQIDLVLNNIWKNQLSICSTACARGRARFLFFGLPRASWCTASFEDKEPIF